jgi:hypothetical protein
MTQGIRGLHPVADEVAADGGAGASNAADAMEIYFTAFGKGGVKGIQSGDHRLVGRYMKIRQGKALVTDLTSIVPGFFTQYGKIRRAFAFAGQVNEGIEPGIDEGSEAPAGVELIMR